MTDASEPFTVCTAVSASAPDASGSFTESSKASWPPGAARPERIAARRCGSMRTRLSMGVDLLAPSGLVWLMWLVSAASALYTEEICPNTQSSSLPTVTLQEEPTETMTTMADSEGCSPGLPRLTPSWLDDPGDEHEELPGSPKNPMQQSNSQPKSRKMEAPDSDGQGHVQADSEGCSPVLSG